jgi:transposase
MVEVITVGVDLAKNVFQLHGVNSEGQPVLRKQLRRSQMLEFFQCQAAWSAWKPAPVRITGRAN